MKTESITDCLNFIDIMIIYDIEKIDSMQYLENMRDYFLDNYIKKRDE